MPKKIKFESFKYRFLIAAQDGGPFSADMGQPLWKDFVRNLEFSYEKGAVRISWNIARPGALSVPLDEPRFYLRGDNEQHIARQIEAGFMDTEDPIKLKNDSYFKESVKRVAQSAGYQISAGGQSDDSERLTKERAFHDAWAGAEDIDSIDVRTANEACTAPEMRYITQRLGDIRGKRLLDVGCGLGEASVYFALLGANVTSSDLSQGMLDATCRLAQTNAVSVTPHVAAAEDLKLSPDALFDIIYAGNLLHHVDIDQTLSRIKPHLAPNGVVVTWDPLAYNPVINVYRAMATDVRTPDEHPLKWSDIQLFRKHFGVVETRYFWLTTLVIFLLMAVVQRRNPNKERFWKVVVQEGEKWRWLYSPLEKLDRLLLLICPPLRVLCWNVVVVAARN
jgi:2-polyprenyl-3-methyl-5-hydroxy-6-metoxy-1,4-benzoquinol methylase